MNPASRRVALSYRAFRSTKALLNWQDNALAEIAVVKRDLVHHSRFAPGERGCRGTRGASEVALGAGSG